MTKKLRVLVACEYSGVVRDAFAARGHDAWSCDILNTDVPGNHYMQDVRRVLRKTKGEWDLIIAHPPCTRLCNSGVSWLDKRGLWGEMEDAADFFNYFKGKAPMVCIENPIPHGYATARIGKYTQKVQPWMFGDNYSKQTCLWLENLPPLVPTSTLDGSTAEPFVMTMWPSEDRAKLRSKTFPGLAKAMAEQWG